MKLTTERIDDAITLLKYLKKKLPENNIKPILGWQIVRKDGRYRGIKKEGNKLICGISLGASLDGAEQKILKKELELAAVGDDIDDDDY